MFVADTLSDPHAAEAQLGSGLGAISESKRRANKIKSDVPVTVVIGNPPYGDKAEGQGGWIEKGASGVPTPLDAFRLKGNGLTEFSLKNLYIYFWRWATWKVFESIPEHQEGVICFITSSGYFRGPGAKGMREYLRREASEGWVIDLTPEGKRPPAATAVFAIETPVAIAIFVRRSDNERSRPAPIRYMELTGKRTEKFASLKAVTLNTDAGWGAADSTWTASLLPAAGAAWVSSPALSQLFAWVGPGIAANRNWVYAPIKSDLTARWFRLVNTQDRSRRSELFRETRDARLDKLPLRLPGADTQAFVNTFASEQGELTGLTRVSFRSFDRQWIIADARVLHAPSPVLWSARSAGQVFIGEQHSVPVAAGALPLSFSKLIVDLNYTDNRGGRVLPLLHPDGTPNLAPGLLDALAASVGLKLTHEDVLAYIAGVVSHPGFTATFEDELTTPGVRVPITTDPALWTKAVELGREVVWLHTYGESFVDKAEGRELGNVRCNWPSELQPLYLEPVKEMPIKHFYDAANHAIYFTGESGDRNGVWGPVEAAVFDYTVGGMNVIGSWFKYRKKNPGGKKTSPLDDIHVTEWPHEWSLEFTELLTVLTRLVALESDQKALLDEILAGELSTVDELADAGVKWPQSRDDRKPRRKPTEDPHQLTIPDE